MSEQIEDLPRPEITVEEKLHETRVKMLNSQFPNLDPLMCSVLLKAPPELMKKLIEDPKMWIIPPATTTHLIGNVLVSDPEPEDDSQLSPRSVLM
jgi:hypothetical protein